MGSAKLHSGPTEHAHRQPSPPRALLSSSRDSPAGEGASVNNAPVHLLNYSLLLSAANTFPKQTSAEAVQLPTLNPIRLVREGRLAEYFDITALYHDAVARFTAAVPASLASLVCCPVSLLVLGPPRAAAQLATGWALSFSPALVVPPAHVLELECAVTVVVTALILRHGS